MHKKKKKTVDVVILSAWLFRLYFELDIQVLASPRKNSRMVRIELSDMSAMYIHK